MSLDGSGSWTCTKCDKTFSNEKNLKKHMDMVHHPKKLKCPQCEVVLSSDRNMHRHMQLHKGEKPYACSICGEEYHRREQVERHLNTQHNVSRIECKLCGKGFGSKYTAVEHLKLIHNYNTDKKDEKEDKNPGSGETNGRNFKCFSCGKTFLTHYHKERHMRMHHGAKKQIAIVKPAFLDDKKSSKTSNKPKVTKSVPSKTGSTKPTIGKSVESEEVDSTTETMDKTEPVTKQGKSGGECKNIPKSRSDKTQMQCKQCSRILCSPYSLERHMSSVHSKQINPAFKCMKCSKTFSLAHIRDKHQFYAHRGSKNTKPVVNNMVKRGARIIKKVSKEIGRNAIILKKNPVTSKKSATQVVKKVASKQNSQMTLQVKKNYCKLCKHHFVSNYNLRRHEKSVHKKT